MRRFFGQIAPSQHAPTEPPSKQPIMVGLYRNFAQQTFFPVNTEMAALTIASVPPIILFLVFQRQIIRGIALTGLTGS